VTRLFPDLRIGFLEGGVAWACELFAGLVGHWEKRNRAEIWQLDPDRLDVDALMSYFDRYGDDDAHARIDEIRAYFARPAAQPANVDEFAACEIETAADLRALFEPSFYFGCEADDRTVALASSRRNGLGVDLNATLGSDIGHWDVPHAAHVIPEAWELVASGAMTEDEFRRFTYDNARRFLTTSAPDFFDATVLAGQSVAG